MRVMKAPDLTPGGKLLLADGVAAVEGEAGGGLAAWSVIAGGETKDRVGARAHATYVSTPDFSLETGGVSVGLFNRVELSYARQAFDTGAPASLGRGRHLTFDQDVLGAKVQLFVRLVPCADRHLRRRLILVVHEVAKLLVRATLTSAPNLSRLWRRLLAAERLTDAE